MARNEPGIVGRDLFKKSTGGNAEDKIKFAFLKDKCGFTYTWRMIVCDR